MSSTTAILTMVRRKKMAKLLRWLIESYGFSN
jgi:hypothetical protein